MDFGDAYDDTRSRVEMHENNIETLNKEIGLLKQMKHLKIQMLRKIKKPKQWLFQKIYDDFVADGRKRQEALANRNKQTQKQELVDNN